MADSYLFVNGTGVGMKPLEGLSVVPDESYFRPELIVVDIPYSPLETKMRAMAKKAGCKTMNGMGMMLFQGAAAFKLWTGKDMPIEHMKEVLHMMTEACAAHSRGMNEKSWRNVNEYGNE